MVIRTILGKVKALFFKLVDGRIENSPHSRVRRILQVRNLTIVIRSLLPAVNRRESTRYACRKQPSAG